MASTVSIIVITPAGRYCDPSCLLVWSFVSVFANMSCSRISQNNEEIENTNRK